MLLTITTTHEPATDLGYLLVKHPDRVHATAVPTGTAYVCFPAARHERCTAALLLEVDPARLIPARGGAPSFSLARYVNDRPYAASSLLAASMNKLFRSAMRGESQDRPELAATAIPLELNVPTLRCRGGVELVRRLFDPMGWIVRAEPVPLDPTHPEWGESRYVDLTLTGRVRLADALNQLYVLLPVLDDAKHYWVSPDEVDKLLRAGEGWLAAHPERDLIAHRYLSRRRALTAAAIERLEMLATAEEIALPDSVDAPVPGSATEEDAALPPDVRVPLARQRRAAVLAALPETGTARVLDLGCGSGALLGDLLADKRFTEVVGVDISSHALQLADRRVKPGQRARVQLWQSALTYADDRLRGFDAAILMEVIEHIDPSRLPAVEASVFGHARPSTVVVTTPNVEYNVRYPSMAPGTLRHQDHRFEWSRAEFAAWASRVAGAYGYDAAVHGVGDADAEIGSPTQLAVFTRSAVAT